LGYRVLFQGFADFDTVDFGHFDIKDNQIGTALTDHGQGLFPVTGLENLIISVQGVFQVLANKAVIVYEQNFFAWNHHHPLREQEKTKKVFRLAETVFSIKIVMKITSYYCACS